MPKNQEIGIRISGSVDPSLNKSIMAAEQGMQRLNKGTGNVSSGFKGAGRSGTQFGTSSVNAVNNLDAALASAGIIAGLTSTYNAFMECVEAADKYETAIAKVSTIADTSEKSIGAIKSELTALSNETGKSVLELSEAEYQALSASVDTAKSVDFVSQANQLAVGGFTDAASAVDVLTTTLNAYGLEADKASAISDMLILTQNKGKTTVNELASSLGTVIPTAAAYSTNMENVSTAYALLTKNGIATANTGTAVRGVLNELGDTGSDVSKTLYKLSGQTFAGLMSNGKSLGDIIEMLSKSVNGDATAFRGLWSNARAAQAALTLFNTGAEEFNTVLGDMENSSGTTAKAYATMTSTAEHAQEVFGTSAENLRISIGEVLSPQVEEMYQLGTNALQMIDSFVKEHPEVVQALAAGAVGLGVVAGGLLVYTAGTKIATTVTTLFTAAMEANPLFMGLTIAAGVITAVAMFASAMSNATADANQLTYASKKQKDEIDELNTEYDEACQKYGKTSDEAIALKLKIDDLTTEYENNKQTIGDLIQKQGDLNDKYAELQESDKSSSLDEEAASAGYLSNKLFSLAEQTNRTAAENQEMYSIINKLNEQFPELSLNYDEVISKTGQTKEAVQNYLKGLYDQEQYKNAQDQWTKTYGLLQQQKEQATALGKQVAAAGEEYGKSEGGAIAYHKYQAAMDQMVEYTNSSGEKVKMSLREAYHQSSDNIKSMEKDLDKYEKTMLGISGSSDKNAQSAKDWKSATSTALQGLQTEIDALAASYDEAYGAAYKAITGTVGITKKLSNETDVTASSMRENWRDQTEWINKYSSNLQKAQKYGVTKGLIDSLSDGSEQSGQYINQIIKQLDGMNEADAKKFVKGLNDDFKGVTKAEKSFAKTVAQYKTDFNSQMDKMVNKAKTSVESMGLKGKAKSKAVETIQGYIEGIQSQLSKVDSAAAAVKNAVSSKLTTKNITPYQTPKVEENAKGTKHSTDIFLAGEEGPELIVNAKGSQVFTAAETQRILSGEADTTGNQTITMLDVPELIAQLAPRKPGLSLSDMADNISNTTNDNSSTFHVTYAPTIQVKSEGGRIDRSEIQKASRMTQNEFAKFMQQYEKDRKRTKFKSK